MQKSPFHTSLKKTKFSHAGFSAAHARQRAKRNVCNYLGSNITIQTSPKNNILKLGMAFSCDSEKEYLGSCPEQSEMTRIKTRSPNGLQKPIIWSITIKCKHYCWLRSQISKPQTSRTTELLGEWGRENHGSVFVVTQSIYYKSVLGT